MTVRGRGTCPRCESQDRLLYRFEPTDDSLGLACPDCCRARAKVIERYTPCDRGDGRYAWRNPFTRRNEYLCGVHHAESADGVTLNWWQARNSKPLGIRAPVVCELTDSSCRGEIKYRGPQNQMLCTKHAGKISAGWAVEDKEV